MKLRELVTDHIENHALCPGALTLNDWTDKKWLTATVEGRSIRVFPLWGVRNALRMHDMHHVLTGYSTSVEGEIELAAWELGSGGCHLNIIFWFDRLALTLWGLCAERTITVAAFQRGRTCRNLYGKSLAEVLDLNVEGLRRRLGIHQG